MKEAEAGLLIAAGDIERAVLFRATALDDWEIHLYGDLPSYIVNRIELARGGARTWSSLDTAHDWLMRLAQEIRFVVQVDGARKAREPIVV